MEQFEKCEEIGARVKSTGHKNKLHRLRYVQCTAPAVVDKKKCHDLCRRSAEFSASSSFSSETTLMPMPSKSAPALFSEAVLANTSAAFASRPLRAHQRGSGTTGARPPMGSPCAPACSQHAAEHGSGRTSLGMLNKDGCLPGKVLGALGSERQDATGVFCAHGWPMRAASKRHQREIGRMGFRTPRNNGCLDTHGWPMRASAKPHARQRKTASERNRGRMGLRAPNSNACLEAHG